ncbi:hypothetical protein TrRE_jg10467 [Triparma retinervis]|uniref:EF-hand domain-containing protein n=1 Tax=Triparma retinervis TaxID=2557542 RepID=A0A9W6ZLE9_9STRA|nr:hypothetical protein TrRE_jg10467 [Triparma retinervis]
MGSARRPGTGGPASSRSRGAMFSAPAESHVDPEEFLARMRATKAAETKAKAKSEVAALDGYNPYSRPKVSNSIPLRSAFLDPRVNNIPKSKTRSELMRTIKATNIPHHSFDIDGDGYVSQEDLLLGKRFDLDGNGVLDPDEQEVGRRIIAEEFFKAHRHDLHLFGDEYVGPPEEANIDRVAKSHTFTKIMNGLKEKEKHYRDRGSYNMTEALTVWNPDLVKNNFYADKFDVTAWNDFGAEPRAKDFVSNGKHHGSRHAMFNLRKNIDREVCQRLLDKAEAKKPKYSTRRVALMTNVAIENS